MTPEEKKLLEETHALSRDNHRMLRSVRRHQLVMDFGKFAIWLALIALAGYYYLFSLKPAFDTFQESGTVEVPAGPFGIPSAELQKLIESYKAAQ